MNAGQKVIFKEKWPLIWILLMGGESAKANLSNICEKHDIDLVTAINRAVNLYVTSEYYINQGNKLAYLDNNNDIIYKINELDSNIVYFAEKNFGRYIFFIFWWSGSIFLILITMLYIYLKLSGLR